MTIDWNHFTPGASLAGGILIGLAVALMILANGRIAGISGILAGLANRNRHELFWRVAFVAGIVVSPWLYSLFFPLPDIDYGDRSWALLILAGLAVGYWSSTEDVLQNWSVDREFMPGIPDEERTRRLKGWNKAVRCSYGWAKED